LDFFLETFCSIEKKGPDGPVITKHQAIEGDTGG
jgi:hypothetical protein